jgi:hypothetical protein
MMEAKLREGMTQPRGTTTHKACFLINKAVGIYLFLIILPLSLCFVDVWLMSVKE